MLKKEIVENMKYIVDNCMGDSKSACTTACPMNTDAKRYIALMGENRGEEAIKVIREELFIPRVLGRVCAHPCESACRRGKEDEAISIAGLKRYIADNYDNPDMWDISKKEPRGKKVAIIGFGPAGAQGAITLLKEGYDVTIFEKNSFSGGMLRYGIPEYRLPRDIIESEFSLIDRLGGEIKFNTEIGKDILFETLEKEYDAVLVSIGKQLGRKDRSLNNCDANGVLTAVEFLREISLTRESKEAKGNVLTVGGGDVAMDCARSALRLKNSNDSYVIFLEKNLESLTASKHEVEGAIAEGVKFIPSSGIKEILINEEGRVNGVIVKRCESIFNEKGEFSPKFNEENLEKIDVDTLIFA